jgi:hypothetical protein
MIASSPRPRPGRRPDLALPDLWRQRLRAFEHSGLSAAAFCDRHDLSLPSFYSWRRRLRARTAPAAPDRTAPETPFVPIRLLPAPAGPAVEMVLPSGVVLRLNPGCDPAFVRSLVAGLGGLLC